MTPHVTELHSLETLSVVSKQQTASCNYFSKLPFSDKPKELIMASDDREDGDISWFGSGEFPRVSFAPPPNNPTGELQTLEESMRVSAPYHSPIMVTSNLSS